MSTQVAQPSTLYRRVFMSPPIRRRSLISSSMNTRITGSSTPLSICTQTRNWNTGMPGIRDSPAPRKRRKLNRPKKTGARRKLRPMPLGRPKASATEKAVEMGRMAAAILPISAAFAVAEAFGLPKGIGLSLRRAPVFFGLFSFLLFLGAGLSLIPGIPVFQFLVWVQMLNGVLLPVFLVFMLLLINDRRLMGELINTRLYNVLGWATCVLIVVSVAFVLLQQTLGLMGVSFP